MERDWVGYERDLNERKRKVSEFFLEVPSRKRLEGELQRMNDRKEGPPFQIPHTVIVHFHFFKQMSGMDDRMLAFFLSGFLQKVIGCKKKFHHSTIVKRRQLMELEIPFDIKPKSLQGKTLYFDGMCLRVGRGGFYRCKRYHTDIKYLRIMLFTDDSDRVVDFVIGDEHDSEVNLLREKLPQIKQSGAKAADGDGAFAAREVIVDCVQNGIKPIIRVSDKVKGAHANIPPPEVCIKKKKDEDLIWET